MNKALSGIDIDFQLRFATVKDTMRAHLGSAAIGARVKVTSVDLEKDAAAWLSAVGLDRGEEVTVLRRGALGGPLHVRTASGGEFAVARELAVCIGVEPA